MTTGKLQQTTTKNQFGREGITWPSNGIVLTVIFPWRDGAADAAGGRQACETDCPRDEGGKPAGARRPEGQWRREPQCMRIK